MLDDADNDESVSLPSVVEEHIGDGDPVEKGMVDMDHDTEAWLHSPAYMDGAKCDDVGELYCAPNICLVAQTRGLRAGLSVYVKAGHDLYKKSVQ